MARYKALRKGFPNRQVEENEEFDYDGVPGSWMEPLDAAAKAAFADRFGKNATATAGQAADVRPIGNAAVGSTPTGEVATLKARIAELEKDLRKTQTSQPAAGGEGSDELDPAVKDAIEKRRSKREG